MSIAVGSATVQIEMDGGVAGSFDETSFGGSFPGATGESPLELARRLGDEDVVAVLRRL